MKKIIVVFLLLMGNNYLSAQYDTIINETKLCHKWELIGEEFKAEGYILDADLPEKGQFLTFNNNHTCIGIIYSRGYSSSGIWTLKGNLITISFIDEKGNKTTVNYKSFIYKNDLILAESKYYVRTFTLSE